MQASLFSIITIPLCRKIARDQPWQNKSEDKLEIWNAMQKHCNNC
jgi:hypothetical protein